MIQNSDFSVLTDPARPGVPKDWTVTTVATGEATAEWVGDSSYLVAGTEGFEHGWSADPQLLRTALINVSGFPTEDFDSWVLAVAPGGGHAHPYQVEMVLTLQETAPFASATLGIETFFEGWASQDFQTGFGGSHAAFGAGTREDFDWGAEVLTLSSVSAASFDTGRVSFSGVPREMFNARPPQTVTVLSVQNAFQSVTTFVGAIGDIVTLAPLPGGALPEPVHEGYEYFINSVDGNVFTLRESIDSPLLVFDRIGAGTLSVGSDPGKFWVDALL